VSPRAGLKECGSEKPSCTGQVSNPEPSSSYACSYTDYAIPTAAGIYSRSIFLEIQSQHITNTDEKI